MNTSALEFVLDTIENITLNIDAPYGLSPEDKKTYLDLLQSLREITQKLELWKFNRWAKELYNEVEAMPNA